MIRKIGLFITLSSLAMVFAGIFLYYYTFEGYPPGELFYEYMDRSYFHDYVYRVYTGLIVAISCISFVIGWIFIGYQTKDPKDRFDKHSKQGKNILNFSINNQKYFIGLALIISGFIIGYLQDYYYYPFFNEMYEIETFEINNRLFFITEFLFYFLNVLYIVGAALILSDKDDDRWDNVLKITGFIFLIVAFIAIIYQDIWWKYFFDPYEEALYYWSWTLCGCYFYFGLYLVLRSKMIKQLRIFMFIIVIVISSYKLFVRIRDIFGFEYDYDFYSNIRWFSIIGSALFFCGLLILLFDVFYSGKFVSPKKLKDLLLKE